MTTTTAFPANPLRDMGPAPKLPPNWEAADAPLVPTQAVEACPVCSCKSHRPFAQGYDYELETCRNPWSFVQCDSCHHVWLNPRPSVEALSTIYPPTYYAYNYDEQVSGVAIRAKQWLDRRRMATIVQTLGRPAQSFLDIGCGEGRALEAMHRAGVAKDRCFGLELDDDVVARLKSQGFSAMNRRVEDCDAIAPESLDLATMFHVIEHVDDPGAVVEQVAGWLTPGGVFALETPNLDSLDARLGRSGLWGGYHIPRHWNLFTASTVTRLLESRGLEVLAIRYQSGHSFWIYGTHHWLRYGWPKMKRLAAWFNPFRNLPMLALVTAMDRGRALLGMKTSAMLVLARKPLRGASA